MMTTIDFFYFLPYVKTLYLSSYSQGFQIAGAYFCKLLAMAGITCANDGTCIGNIRDGKVCQCKDGYFGPLCKDYVPSKLLFSHFCT